MLCHGRSREEVVNGNKVFDIHRFSPGVLKWILREVEVMRRISGRKGQLNRQWYVVKHRPTDRERLALHRPIKDVKHAVKK